MKDQVNNQLNFFLFFVLLVKKLHLLISLNLITKDVDTRRRAASDLVQAMSTQFEKQVVAIFSSYVSALLQVILFKNLNNIIINFIQ